MELTNEIMYQAIIGVSPKNGEKKNIIDLKRIETPLGTMIACATEKGISLLEFSYRKMLETQLKTIAKIFNATIIQGYNKHFESLEKEQKEYFAGQRKTFEVPLYTPGTDF
jgi:AraC family transcriptional regulator, regulatory protein of adaptative response / methylated-DNA-[protein]-cysteine methyltransferase